MKIKYKCDNCGVTINFIQKDTKKKTITTLVKSNKKEILTKYIPNFFMRFFLFGEPTMTIETFYDIVKRTSVYVVCPVCKSEKELSYEDKIIKSNVISKISRHSDFGYFLSYNTLSSIKKEYDYREERK